MAKNHKPFGGFLDFNHNGKVEPWELWMVSQMLNDSANTDSDIDIDIDDYEIVSDIDSYIDTDADVDINEDVCLESENAGNSYDEEYGWRENCPDGSEYGISPDDFETEMDYMTALEDAEEEIRYEWSDYYDETECGISPDDYETEEEYLDVLTEAEDAIPMVVIKPVISIEFEPEIEEATAESPERLNEANYPNQRTYRAALELTYNNNNNDIINRSRFILDNPNIIAAKYLTINGTFLFGQAIKENFRIPISLPDEDEWVETNFLDIIKGISEHDIPLAIEIWDWCIDNFMPYIKYSSGFDKEILTDTILAHFYEMPDNFADGLVQYIEAKPEFSKKIIRYASEISEYVYEILHKAILRKDYQTLLTVLEDVLSNENADMHTVVDMIDMLIFCCETWEETETMNTLRKYILPRLTTLDVPEYKKCIVKWNKRISAYCQTVEEQIRRKETKEKNKLQLCALVDSMRNIINRIEQGDVWEPFDANTPEFITYEFIYPNGKNGDIDMFIASNYGQVDKLDELHYSALLPTIHKKQVLLLEYIYAHSLHDDIPRKELDQFLHDYNLGHRLRQYCDTYLTLEEGYSSSETEAEKTQRLYYDKIRSKAMEVANRYMDSVRHERDKVYAEIVKQGLTSARWTSEQKAYLIVKKLYPDAIFQYRENWLGFQSLDIYIPSKRIAIEYQGKQHYEGIKLFGGDEGLHRARIRDEAKKRKCIENGVRLIEWRYDAPLTKEYIKDRISEVVLSQK